MIIICEPQSKGISHIKVNSGFIYGLSLAYPGEQIEFFSETSHFKEIIEIFKSNKIQNIDLKHFTINFNAAKSFSISGIIGYFFLIKSVFDKVLEFGSNKVFFLSMNPVILCTIKILKVFAKYKNICCTVVLHGELEDIANVDYTEPYLPRPIAERVTLVRLIKHPGIVLLMMRRILFQPFESVSSSYSLFFKKYFRTKKMMMWRHSKQYHYISLSPHVTENAKKYLDTKLLNFKTIIMPIIFAKPLKRSKNKFIKFAVFGYGDSGQMQKMLNLLSQREISAPYEIKIISMDNRGTEGFKNIKYISRGKVLGRSEMENATKDVDVFINLYTKNRHRFGCSLSIFEAFSYLKPVIHLSNPGYNYFNKPGKPIGYRCEDMNIFVDKLADMIGNFHLYKAQLLVFRRNMLEYRSAYDVRNNLKNLKESFKF